MCRTIYSVFAAAFKFLYVDVDYQSMAGYQCVQESPDGTCAPDGMTVILMARSPGVTVDTRLRLNAAVARACVDPTRLNNHYGTHTYTHTRGRANTNIHTYGRGHIHTHDTSTDAHTPHTRASARTYTRACTHTHTHKRARVCVAIYADNLESYNDLK
jgi:hypothetical protein